MPIKVEDWIPQEPWQGPPLPEFLNIYWPWYTPPGAEFRVNNLVISPEVVYPGQPVTISATVTNIGSIAGDYTVKLGGDFTGEQSITLEPTESETISFEVVPTVAKTYSITVDGLHGTFRATEAPVEVIDFELTRPSVSPATITPGTSITIACPITSACTKSQTITVKVIIYEGSILPGHGAVIATKTSPSFSIAPDQTYNVIVHHTAVAGTIDRRDIEVEVYIAGTLVKESEWDDVYYVEEPVVHIATLRPSANGDLVELTPSGVSNNYDCVDDADGHDGDATYVYSTAPEWPYPPAYQLDLYALADLPASVVSIKKITLHYIIKTTAYYLYARFKPAVKTYGQTYFLKEVWISIYDSYYSPSHASWTEHTLELTLNPYTGLAWTPAEVNALQAGQALMSSSARSTVPSKPVFCTQVYVEVECLG